MNSRRGLRGVADGRPACAASLAHAKRVPGRGEALALGRLSSAAGHCMGERASSQPPPQPRATIRAR